MALSLLTNPPTVGVIITCLQQQITQYKEWKQLFSNLDLINCVGFDKDATVCFTPSTDTEYAISWLEIGDNSTSHHPHDIVKRLNSMQQYIDSQDSCFQFSKKWVIDNIDWTY